MEYEKFIGKIAADKNSKKLGRIVKLEMIQDSKTKINKPYLLIRVKKFLRKDIIVLLEAEKILKAEPEYVWFDILKDNFEQEVVETRALMYLYQ